MMRTVLTVGAAAALALSSLGCAMTDYPSMGPVNKSHGVIDCADSQDRIGNTQQAVEPLYLELFFRDPGADPDSGQPQLLVAPVDRATAREWGRFVGPFSAVAAQGVRTEFTDGSVEGARFEQGGVKDLADGSVRITTFRSALPAPTAPVDFPPLSCGFAGSAVARSATEGGALSQTLPGFEPPHAVPGAYMRPDTVAIDPDGQSFQWGANIVAMTPEAAEAGYSGFTAALERAETHIEATPVTRRAGASLGEMLSGVEQTWTLPDGSDLEGFSFTAWGEMNESGILMNVTALSAPDGTSYQAGSQPIRMQLGQLGDPWADFSLTPAEELKVLIFARDAGLLDRALTLPPHLEGIPLPRIALRFNSGWVDARIDELTELFEGEPGGEFGG